MSEPIAAVADLASLAERFAGRAAEHDRQGQFPHANFADLAAQGVLGLTIPREYGGDGLGLRDSLQVLAKVAGGDASTGLVLAMHTLHHGVIAYRRHWPEALHARIAVAGVREGALVNTVQSEPGLGNPARGGSLVTRADVHADGWHLSGHKSSTTGSHGLRWAIVLADNASAADERGFWLVPLSSPGVSIVDNWHTMGMRATASHDLLLDNVVLPAENLIERFASNRPRSEPIGAAWFILSVTAVYLGIAEAAQARLVAYLAERVPPALGVALSTVGRIREKVGQAQIQLNGARRLLDSLAREHDAEPGSLPMSEIASVKQLVSQHAIEAVQLGLEVAGIAGLDQRLPFERHYRDVLCSRLHGPQADVACLQVADSLWAKPSPTSTRA